MHILCKYQSPFRAKLREHVLYGIFNIKQNQFLSNMIPTLYALDYEWLRASLIYDNDTLSLMWRTALRPEGPDYWSRK